MVEAFWLSATELLFGISGHFWCLHGLPMCTTLFCTICNIDVRCPQVLANSISEGCQLRNLGGSSEIHLLLALAGGLIPLTKADVRLTKLRAQRFKTIWSLAVELVLFVPGHFVSQGCNPVLARPGSTKCQVNVRGSQIISIFNCLPPLILRMLDVCLFRFCLARGCLQIAQLPVHTAQISLRIHLCCLFRPWPLNVPPCHHRSASLKHFVFHVAPQNRSKFATNLSRSHLHIKNHTNFKHITINSRTEWLQHKYYQYQLWLSGRVKQLSHFQGANLAIATTFRAAFAGLGTAIHVAGVYVIVLTMSKWPLTT